MDALHGWLSSISCPYDTPSLLSGHTVAYLLDYHNLSTSPLSTTLSPPITNRAVLSNWNRITHEMGRVGVIVPADSTAMIMAGDQEEVWAKFIRPLFDNLNNLTNHGSATTQAHAISRSSSDGPFNGFNAQYNASGAFSAAMRSSAQVGGGSLSIPSLSLVPTDKTSDGIMREISRFLTSGYGNSGAASTMAMPSSTRQQSPSEVSRLLEALNRRGTIVRECLRTHPASRHACVGLILGLITMALGMEDEEQPRKAIKALSTFVQLADADPSSTTTSSSTTPPHSSAPSAPNEFKTWVLHSVGMSSLLAAMSNHYCLSSLAIPCLWRCCGPPSSSATASLLARIGTLHEYDRAAHLRALHVLTAYAPEKYRTKETLGCLLQDIAGKVKGEGRGDSAATGSRTHPDGGERSLICSAIGTMVKCVEVFIEVITMDSESGETFLQPCFASLLKVIRTSEVTQAALTAVSGVFKVIKRLLNGEKKTEYVRVGVRSIMYVMVEKGGGDVGAFIKECVRGLVEEETRKQGGDKRNGGGKTKRGKLPMGEIASPFIKSLRTMEISMCDVSLFLALAKSGLMGGKYVQQSLAFLSGVCRTNAPMSRSAAVPMLVLLGVHGDAPGVQIWAARFSRDAAKAITEDTGGDEKGEIRKMLTIELCAKVLAVGRREVNDVLEGFLEIQADAMAGRGGGRNVELIKKLLHVGRTAVGKATERKGPTGAGGEGAKDKEKEKDKVKTRGGSKESKVIDRKVLGDD
ncbi:hypothetical protein TrRE_jg562, partial [Triparma retinervis]